MNTADAIQMDGKFFEGPFHRRIDLIMLGSLSKRQEHRLSASSEKYKNLAFILLKGKNKNKRSLLGKRGINFYI